VIIHGFHFSGFWRLGDWAAWSVNWHCAGMWFLAINGLAYFIYLWIGQRALPGEIVADLSRRGATDHR
jgi:thiosulfate reductase cytochrome b subunit